MSDDVAWLVAEHNTAIANGRILEARRLGRIINALERRSSTPEHWTLHDVRVRDRNAIARLGNPDTDPLLRAEMDRRYLLATLDRLIPLVAVWRDAASAETHWGPAGAQAYADCADALEAALNPCPTPCCDACGAAGADLSGPCSDCYGTGHTHPTKDWPR